MEIPNVSNSVYSLTPGSISSTAKCLIGRLRNEVVSGLMRQDEPSSAGDLMIVRFINTFLLQCYICIFCCSVNAEKNWR